MSKRSGARERSKQGGAKKSVSSASEGANGRANSPVLQSGFLVILAHSASSAAHCVSKVEDEKVFTWQIMVKRTQAILGDIFDEGTDKVEPDVMGWMDG